MSSIPSPRTRTVRRRRAAVALVVAAAAVAVVAGVAMSAIATTPRELGDGGPPLGSDGTIAAMPSPITDSDDPSVTGLHADLLAALIAAEADAAEDGVVMEVTSGWRSAQEQEALFQEAVEQYGSIDEASRWVARPETSAHVAGIAVDIGGLEAVVWLEQHGAAYGLCQVYDNEAWHFELRAEAPDEGCPDVYWDPTYDPRMQG